LLPRRSFQKRTVGGGGDAESDGGRLVRTGECGAGGGGSSPSSTDGVKVGEAHRDAAGGADGSGAEDGSLSAEEIGAAIAVAEGGEHGGGGRGAAPPMPAVVRSKALDGGPSNDAEAELSCSLDISEVGSVLGGGGTAAHAPERSAAGVAVGVAAGVTAWVAACEAGTARLEAAAGRSSLRTAHRRTA